MLNLCFRNRQEAIFYFRDLHSNKKAETSAIPLESRTPRFHKDLRISDPFCVKVLATYFCKVGRDFLSYKAGKACVDVLYVLAFQTLTEWASADAEPRELIFSSEPLETDFYRSACTAKHRLPLLHRVFLPPAGYLPFQGKDGFVHGNSGRKPAHTLPDQQKQNIVSLYNSKYWDTNFTHCCELLAAHDSIEISPSCLRKILHGKFILSPRATRSIRKQMNVLSMSSTRSSPAMASLPCSTQTTAPCSSTKQEDERCRKGHLHPVQLCMQTVRDREKDD